MANLSNKEGARLIAAAPELLEALKRADTLLVALQAFIADNELEDFSVDYDEATCDGSCLRDGANFAVTDIRAAISKAEGRS